MPPRGERPGHRSDRRGAERSRRDADGALVRFDYGSIVPWARRSEDSTTYIAGPDALCLRTPGGDTREKTCRRWRTSSSSEGEQVPFVLTWYPSHRPAAERDRRRDEHCARPNPGGRNGSTVHATTARGARMCCVADRAEGAHVRADGRHRGGARPPRCRSCSEGCVTGTTASAGSRRGLHAGRAAGGGLHGGGQGLARLAPARDRRRSGRHPDHVRRRRGAAPDRARGSLAARLQGSKPVRIGNAASDQLQLDVFGEVMDALYHADELGLAAETRSWAIQQKLLEHLELEWREPDEGIWEVRGPRASFHALESHGLGGRSTGQSRAVNSSRRTGQSTAGAACATKSTARSARRASTRVGLVRAVVRREEARCEPLADPARRLPACFGDRACGARSRRSSGSSARKAS